MGNNCHSSSKVISDNFFPTLTPTDSGFRANASMPKGDFEACAAVAKGLVLFSEASEIDHISVGVAEGQIRCAPRLSGGLLNDFYAQRQKPLVFCVYIVHGKGKAYILIAVVFHGTIIVEGQSCSFGQDDLMHRVAVLILDPEQLPVEIGQSNHIICVQTYFADFHLYNLAIFVFPNGSVRWRCRLRCRDSSGFQTVHAEFSRLP